MPPKIVRVKGGYNFAKECREAKRRRVSNSLHWLVERLENETCDLRCIEEHGAMSDDVGYHWEVVEHHMSEPRERTIGYGRTIIEALRDAFKPPND
jgi:hypothetical protein